MTYDNGDDALIWERARQNEGAAFRELFDRHHGRVYRRALGLLGRTDEAEDVTAAAFFELWRKRISVTLIEGSVLPWLLVTTVNLSRNAQRSTARYARLIQSLPREEAVINPRAPESDASQRLIDSLKNLPRIDSALFVLTALEDFSITEAAASVGLKPATARVRLHRARARLRGELHDLQPMTRRSEGNQA